MDSYTLSIACLTVAFACQALICSTGLEWGLRRAPPPEERPFWLTIACGSLFLALHHGYSLELALRTGLYDLRQAILSLIAALLYAFALHRARRLIAAKDDGAKSQ